MNADSICVVHLPARTPYARKLQGDGVAIVNETLLCSGERVPRDASFGWLAKQASFEFFDVLHIHSVELVDLSLIETVLDRCRVDKKRIVMTVHDVQPMFDSDVARYMHKLRELVARGVPLITLTDGAAAGLAEALGEACRPTVLPHGYVVDPGDDRFGTSASGGPGVVFAMYGGFRPNRVMHPVVVNLLFGAPSQDRLRILTRALSPIELQELQDAQETVTAALASKRLDLQLRPFPEDDEIIDFLRVADVLVMPYLWGSHSGQLEMAFDLGLTPVIADTGFFREQWRQHHGLVQEPIWFNWQTGSPYAFGERLLGAVLEARERASPRSRSATQMFRRHREKEHAQVLATYRQLYLGSSGHS